MGDDDPLGEDLLGEDLLGEELLEDFLGESSTEPREEVLLRLVGVEDLLLDPEAEVDLVPDLDEERDPALCPVSVCFLGASFTLFFESFANALDFAIPAFFFFSPNTLLYLLPYF